MLRIHLQLTPNTSPVPFNYQVSLTGAFHKWLGENNHHHGELSLYSFSWLDGGKKVKEGLNFPNGASWFISSYDDVVVKTIVKGIMDDGGLNFGMEVAEIKIQPTPVFGPEERFTMASPVLIKRKDPSKEYETFYFWNDPIADSLLTETLQAKLAKAGMADKDIQVSFDRDYPKAKTKVAEYKGIKNKGSLCPILLKGDPEAIGFAWNVGLGNSTGIGWGAVR